METDIIQTFDKCYTMEYEMLTERGKQFYTSKCQEYLNDGELRVAYLPKLVIWADSYDRYWKLRSEVAEEGETFQTKNKFGDVVMSANPKVKMMIDALKIADNIIAEFGGSIKQARNIGKDKPKETPLDEWEKKYKNG